MASTKKKNGFSFNNFREEYREEIRVGLIAAAIAFFFTQGLPLWDDDYSQWLAQAQGGIGELLARILLPTTNSPGTWGFSDRPLLVLLYLVLNAVFGTWGTGYFLVKALCFGGLAGTLHAWMRRQLDVDTKISRGVIALFAVSTPAIASLIQLSDFSVLSQLVLALILMWAMPLIEKGPSSVAVYKKGWNGMPAAFRTFLLVFFGAVYFGSKLKGDVRLAPVILAVWMAIFRREKLKVYAAPFALTFLATLPWSRELFKNLPPFIPGSPAYQGWTFARFELSRMFEFLFLDVFTFRGPPLSVLGAAGFLITLSGATYAAYRFYGESLERPNARWGFFLSWLGTAAVAAGTLGRLNATFQLRYGILLLVPAVFLIGLAAQAMYEELSPRFTWLKHAMLAVLALQCGFHLFHDYNHRANLGHAMVAVDKIHAEVETKYQNAQFVMLPGFLAYGYKNVPVPAITGRQALANIDDIARLPAGSTFGASWGSSLDPRFSLALQATGCNGSLFDLIAPCGAVDGAVLLRYVGQPQEIARAQELEKQGDLNGARTVLEGYLTRDPENHGVAFALSVYAYRLKDYARMEQLYDKIGPFFPAHTGVAYNWGLSKQGLQKFSEAAKLLERAYKLAPKDYGVGFNLADAYYREGRKSRALATLRELMQKYPDDPAMKSAHNEWNK